MSAPIGTQRSGVQTNFAFTGASLPQVNHLSAPNANANSTSSNSNSNDAKTARMKVFTKQFQKYTADIKIRIQDISTYTLTLSDYKSQMNLLSIELYKILNARHKSSIAKYDINLETLLKSAVHPELDASNTMQNQSSQERSSQLSSRSSNDTLQQHNNHAGINP